MRVSLRAFSVHTALLILFVASPVMADDCENYRSTVENLEESLTKANPEDKDLIKAIEDTITTFRGKLAKCEEEQKKKENPEKKPSKEDPCAAIKKALDTARSNLENLEKLRSNPGPERLFWEKIRKLDALLRNLNHRRFDPENYDSIAAGILDFFAYSHGENSNVYANLVNELNILKEAVQNVLDENRDNSLERRALMARLIGEVKGKIMGYRTTLTTEKKYEAIYTRNRDELEYEVRRLESQLEDCEEDEKKIACTTATGEYDELASYISRAAPFVSGISGPRALKKFAIEIKPYCDHVLYSIAAAKHEELDGRELDLVDSYALGEADSISKPCKALPPPKKKITAGKARSLIPRVSPILRNMLNKAIIFAAYMDESCEPEETPTPTPTPEATSSPSFTSTPEPTPEATPQATQTPVVGFTPPRGSTPTIGFLP